MNNLLEPQAVRSETVAQDLGLEIIVAAPQGTLISSGFTSDLLSDAMANAQEGCAFLTIQAHKNTVAVATLTGASAIFVCSSRTVPEDMFQSCKDEGIGLYRSTENQFILSGKLYQLLYTPNASVPS